MSDAPWLILTRMVQRLRDQVDAMPSIREASVAVVSPLQVRYDTDETPVAAYGSVASLLAIGDRVLTVRVARYVWVLGSRGGLRLARGKVPITGTGAVSAATTVTFPAGVFPSPPVVVTSEVATSAGTTFTVRPESLTADGMTLRLVRDDGAQFEGTYQVSWLAVPE